jgi:hypothetical protein
LDYSKRGPEQFGRFGPLQNGKKYLLAVGTAGEGVGAPATPESFVTTEEKENWKI